MKTLDDLRVLQKYDRSDMLGLLESFPEQCRTARKIGYAFDVPVAFKTVFSSVVCTGLGGSAIGADIARSYISDESPVPIAVNRHYILPAYVNSSSLVIASSYSGNTEETLSAYDDARSRGAKIIAITSGGELKKRAVSDGYPVMTIPAGLPPRAALGYSFFPLLVLFSKIGIIGDKAAEIDAAIECMEMMQARVVGVAVKGRKNIAKSLAETLHGKFAVIYGGQDRIDAVVTRWRGQLAENSKALASSHIFPEMNHNEIVGWDNPGKLLKQFVAIFLRDSEDHGRVAKRMDITEKVIKSACGKIVEVRSQGEGRLARIFSLISIGDFTSLYLAILNRRDPTPVDRVTYLKKELAK